MRAVRQLAEHYQRPPDQLTEEDLRNYFLHLKNVKKYLRSASTIALCGIKFFYDHTIKRPWPTLAFVRAPREKKLPAILSREEVRKILGHTRLPRYLVCLSAIYSCGFGVTVPRIHMAGRLWKLGSSGDLSRPQECFLRASRLFDLFDPLDLFRNLLSLFRGPFLSSDRAAT